MDDFGAPMHQRNLGAYLTYVLRSCGHVEIIHGRYSKTYEYTDIRMMNKLLNTELIYYIKVFKLGRTEESSLHDTLSSIQVQPSVPRLVQTREKP